MQRRRKLRPQSVIALWADFFQLSSRRARITEDPLLTSLDNIEAELQEQLYFIDMLPGQYEKVIVTADDLEWPTFNDNEADNCNPDEHTSVTLAYYAFENEADQDKFFD